MGQFYYELKDKPRINNQIRAPEVRVIDDEEGNLGVMSLQNALTLAREKGLDLIEVSDKTIPPIAKITDLGKYLYTEKKKAKGQKQGHRTETKSIQIKIGTGGHDLELKSRKASEFLKEGHRVKLDLFLPGRAKYLSKDFLSERLERFLTLITEPYKAGDVPQKSPKGLSIVIEKDKTKKGP